MRLRPAKGIHRSSDSLQFGGELPRLFRRQDRMRAVEINMHLVINSHNRASRDERDARF